MESYTYSDTIDSPFGKSRMLLSSDVSKIAISLFLLREFNRYSMSHDTGLPGLSSTCVLRGSSPLVRLLILLLNVARVAYKIYLIFSFRVLYLPVCFLTVSTFCAIEQRTRLHYPCVD